MEKYIEDLEEFEIFPEKTNFEKGDFNVKIVGLKFFVPLQLFSLFAINKLNIKNVYVFICKLKSSNDSFAKHLNWHPIDVEMARRKILRQLDGHGYHV